MASKKETPKKTDDDFGDLVEFEGRGVRSTKCTATISPKGTITLNAGFKHAAREFLEKTNKHKLFFSKKKNAIVIGFSNDKADNRNFGQLKDKSNMILAARSFFNFNNLDVSELAGRYELQQENIPSVENSWVINLAAPIQKSA